MKGWKDSYIGRRWIWKERVRAEQITVKLINDLVLLFVELVDDDTDEKVEGEEGSGNDEEDEEEVGVDGVLAVRLLVDLQ